MRRIPAVEGEGTGGRRGHGLEISTTWVGAGIGERVGREGVVGQGNVRARRTDVYVPNGVRVVRGSICQREKMG